MLFIYKYQPKVLDDFEMKISYRSIIDPLITMDKLNILFLGDSGSGKTSIIDALIREYYGNVDYENNILHINSLREQGINFYRNDVKTFCQTSSSLKGKKKFVIFDDIELINEQSQQVFRNCIDKYSNNVSFVASCANCHKVIECLQSRFTILRMQPLQRTNIESIMSTIIKAENIIIDDCAKRFVVDVSNNSVKLVINYLEKFHLLACPINLAIAQSVCTNISFEPLEKYTKALIAKDVQISISILHELYDSGFSVMDILDNYFTYVKHTNILTEDQKYAIIPHICKYITVFHNIHEDEIELCLFTNSIMKELI